MSKNKNIRIGIIVLGILLLVLCVWYGYDLYSQNCAMQNTLCSPMGNRLLSILICLALTAESVLILALVENKREVTTGKRISITRKIIDYSILAIFVFAVSCTLMFVLPF